MKKIFYTLCILAVPVIIGILIYQRMRANKEQVPVQNAQTIIPMSQQIQMREDSKPDDISDNIQSFITLLSDEALVEDVQADVNDNGKEDRVVAVKKLSDQYIYLIVFMQENESQLFTRTLEIKTEATHAKTFSLSTIKVQEYTHPLIVYSGMNADSQQVFGIYALQSDDGIITESDTLLNIQADGQIVPASDKDDSLKSYIIRAYYADSDAPNTLNQIEKQYRWNGKKHLFEQTNEMKIPGKKIESQFLKKFQTGSIDTFREFLDGLWYQPTAKNNQNRNIFFNHAENEIIFSVNNIQEIFKIVSTIPRRFGVSISTKNEAISSINRRLDIELTGVDEVAIRVIDDIARLKIGVSSNWDGTYRKLNNTVRTVPKNSPLENIKQKLLINDKIWTSTEGYTLHFSNIEYQLSQDTTQDLGWYTIFQIKDTVILQLKNRDGRERFFTVVFNTTDKRLILTEVSVALDSITLMGTPPLMFE